MDFLFNRGTGTGHHPLLQNVPVRCTGPVCLLLMSLTVNGVGCVVMAIPLLSCPVSRSRCRWGRAMLIWPRPRTIAKASRAGPQFPFLLPLLPPPQLQPPRRSQRQLSQPLRSAGKRLGFLAAPPARRWFYVRLLLSAAGLLRSAAASAWETHPFFAPIWRAAMLDLTCAAPVAIEALLFI